MAAKSSGSIRRLSPSNESMTTLNRYLCVLLMAGSLSLTSWAAEPIESRFQEPKLCIDDALTIARDFARQHHIQVSDKYIDSARLDCNPRGDHGKFWLVTWLRNEYANGVAIKGGQLYVRIYMDRTAEVTYGE